MRIIVDAMGGDHAPKAIVEGCVQAVNELGVSIILVGREAAVREELDALDYQGDAISLVHAEDVIGGEEDPVTAIKRKDTSMRVALSLLKDGKGDAVVSAGNTGALIAGATLFLKRIKGVRRAALTPVMPTTNGGCFLLVDAGANSDCTPAFLKQFAIMGSIYMKSILGVKEPRVKLVNIGAEENKGPELMTETNALLKEIPIRYEGYIEGRDIPFGEADVVVCDGFTGNIILKLMEGMGLGLTGMIKKIFLKNIVSKAAAMMVKGGLKEFKKSMDYTEYGGAPVLGVTRPVIKAHGSSNGKAFFHAIRQAKKLTEERLVDAIAENIEQYGLDARKGETDE
ncbi:MAG: phosphate acyltransferase PlsX [Clostridia bacterium]|nr:phosphate acyltransferase PlsX [Clostridia bacterium]